MCTEQITLFQTIGLIFVGGVQAFFAFRLWKVSREQNKLSKTIDESNKLSNFWNEYSMLSENRKKLWDSLHHYYEVHKNNNVPERIEQLIDESKFPVSKSDLFSKENLITYVEDHDAQWERDFTEIWIWTKSFMSVLSTRYQYNTILLSELTYFWNKWASFSPDFDIRKYMQPNRKELTMLSWLEFAKVLETKDDEGYGKYHLFELTKKLWEDK